MASHSSVYTIYSTLVHPTLPQIPSFARWTVRNVPSCPDIFIRPAPLSPSLPSPLILRVSRCEFVRCLKRYVSGFFFSRQVREQGVIFFTSPKIRRRRWMRTMSPSFYRETIYFHSLISSEKVLKNLYSFMKYKILTIFIFSHILL